MQTNLWNPEYINYTFRDNPQLFFSEAQQFFPAAPPADIADRIEKISSDLRDTFLQMAAEGWLQDFAGGGCSWQDLPSCLAGVSPFAEGPRLKEIQGSLVAVAVFPLSGGTRPPTVGHVWLIQKPEQHPECFFSIDKATWQGESFQLAQALAQNALKTTPENRSKLASQWIATGKLSGDVLCEVQAGNKFDLQVPVSSSDITQPVQRTWILPGSMRGAIPQRGIPARFSRSLDDAWHVISGQGIAHGSLLAWPEAPVHYHTFVSGALEPAASMFLSIPHIKSCHLWVSKNFQKHAKVLKVTLHHFRPELDPIIMPIDSNDVPLIEETLKAGPLGEHLVSTDPVIFNITSGNRMMPMPVNNIARLHEQLWLVYRNFDDKEHWSFDCLVHDGIPPSIYRLTGKDESPAKTINASVLFSGPREREFTMTPEQYISNWTAT